MNMPGDTSMTLIVDMANDSQRRPGPMAASSCPAFAKAAYLLRVRRPGPGVGGKKGLHRAQSRSGLGRVRAGSEGLDLGQVRDDRGQPIPKATITPTERHHGR